MNINITISITNLINMGCGASRIANEFVEKNPKVAVGNLSDFEDVLTQLESHKNSHIVKILKVKYYERSKCSKGDAQEWKIQATFSDGKRADETHDVYLTPKREFIVNDSLWLD